MSVPTAPRALPRAPALRLPRLLAPILVLLGFVWLTWYDGRVPSFLSPTVERTLYLKLPIAGTRFHWRFRDRGALLAGELTLRIVNTARRRDQTLVIFRNGALAEGWKVIDDERGDGTIYFGFSTDRRFPTAVGDSVIVTLTAAEDLRGQGPYSQGTLPAGTWVATGTYTGLYGGTLNPVRDLVLAGDPPIAFLTCWDTAWALRDAKNEGWMGPKPPAEDDASRSRRIDLERGVDGRRCRSTL